MNRKAMIAVILGFLVLGFAAAGETRSLTGGRGIPVVSDPKDLSLLNLKALSDYLYADLKNKGDFGLVRRIALAVKANQMGIPNPRKKTLHGGFVIGKGSNGHSSAILVMVGDLKFKDIRAALEKDYREYMETNHGTPSITDVEINGVRFEKFGYAERPYEMCVAQLKEKKTLLIGAVPKDDYRLLEETLKVVSGQEALNEKVPAEIEAETSFALTQKERARFVQFNKPKGSLRVKFAKGMKTLAQKLGVPQSQDETVPLDERIRGQLAMSDQVSLKYKWDVDSSKTSAYSVLYDIKMKDRDSAETLRNLLAEQIVRLSDKTQHAADKDSLGRLTVTNNDNEVQLNFLLDTPEAQFQHTSLLLSQLLHYRSFFSILDRSGQGNPKLED